MKTRIHVNQHNIASNKKQLAASKYDGITPELLPVITAKTYKDNRLGNEAWIRDADGTVVAIVVYCPEKPLPCGATCWVETELDVEVLE